jgi:ArsR family transcriptional regulator, arsenate/arsenite/antimonite-responsive transcriptional repressor
MLRFEALMASISPGQEKQSPRPVSPEPAAVISSRGLGETSQRVAGVFKLLADETRLRILLLLFEREELNVRALCDLLEQSQPAVSHHLALLRTDGLIGCRRQGKHNFYHVLPRRIEQLMAMVFDIFPASHIASPAAHPGAGTEQADG